MSRRGALYLLWGERARKRSERSIESLRLHHPGLPVHVVKAPDDSTLLTKATLNDLTPFDSTLYLDADTTVMGNLDMGFEKAEAFGLACRICEVPWARRWNDCDGDTVEYNTGVLFWTKAAAPVFEAWKRHTTVEQTFFDPFGGVRNGYLNDQPSFALAVEESGINPFVLPRNWNLRPTTDREFWGPIKIWHDWRDPPENACQITEQQAASRNIAITYVSYEPDNKNKGIVNAQD